MGSQYGVQ